MKTAAQLCFMVLAGIALSGLVSASGETLSVGIVPQFPPEQIFATWTPVLETLESDLGTTFELRSFQSIPEFERAFIRGELDIAYMNPYHIIMANESQGYVPVVRDDKRRLSGVLVVRNDSGITEVKQLDGKTVAFPSPNAFGASLYMRALLKEQEKINIEPAYVKTHTNVYRHVVTGRAAAGGGVRRTLDREPESLRAQLRILYQTPETYPHPIVIHPRVPEAQRERIQKALLELGQTAETAELLKRIQIPNPTATGLQDYQELQDLGLERFVVQPN
jgi:phosphonate transport system substrate-binding protein